LTAAVGLEGLGGLAGEEASDSAGAAAGGASVVVGSAEDAAGGVETETVAGLTGAVEACRNWKRKGYAGGQCQRQQHRQRVRWDSTNTNKHAATVDVQACTCGEMNASSSIAAVAHDSSAVLAAVLHTAADRHHSDTTITFVVTTV
jgi:hypothetical protein